MNVFNWLALTMPTFCHWSRLMGPLDHMGRSILTSGWGSAWFRAWRARAAVAKSLGTDRSCHSCRNLKASQVEWHFNKTNHWYETGSLCRIWSRIWKVSLVPPFLSSWLIWSQKSIWNFDSVDDGEFDEESDEAAEWILRLFEMRPNVQIFLNT